jgi:hypothetical protein
MDDHVNPNHPLPWWNGLNYPHRRDFWPAVQITSQARVMMQD